MHEAQGKYHIKLFLSALLYLILFDPFLKHLIVDK